MEPLKNVLVVEDEEVIQNLCRRVMTRLGLRVRTVGTVREGLESIQNELPDLLVTDLRLPDGDGIDTVKAFRKKSPQGPVIIMSGSITPEERLKKAEGLNVLEYVSKPFELDVFESAVKKAIEGWQNGEK